jgi:hypothetical protein
MSRFTAATKKFYLPDLDLDVHVIDNNWFVLEGGSRTYPLLMIAFDNPRTKQRVEKVKLMAISLNPKIVPIDDNIRLAMIKSAMKDITTVTFDRAEKVNKSIEQVEQEDEAKDSDYIGSNEESESSDPSSEDNTTDSEDVELDESDEEDEDDPTESSGDNAKKIRNK